jgi:hypothetical protein
MNKIFKLLGIALIVSIAIFGFAACDDDPEDVPGSQEEEGNGGQNPDPIVPPNNTLPYLIHSHIEFPDIVYGTAGPFTATGPILIINPQNGMDNLNLVSYLFTAPSGNLRMDEDSLPGNEFNGPRVQYFAATPAASTPMANGTSRSVTITADHVDRSGSGDEIGDFIEAGTHTNFLIITYEDEDGERWPVMQFFQNQAADPSVRVVLTVNKAPPGLTAANLSLNKINDDTLRHTPTAVTVTRPAAAATGATADRTATAIDGFEFEFEYTILAHKDYFRDSTIPDGDGPNGAWRTPESSSLTFRMRDGSGTGGTGTRTVTVSFDEVNNRVTFSGLERNTNYFIFARTRESHNYEAGPINSITETTSDR